MDKPVPLQIFNISQEKNEDNSPNSLKRCSLNYKLFEYFFPPTNSVFMIVRAWFEFCTKILLYSMGMIIIYEYSLRIPIFTQNGPDDIKGLFYTFFWLFGLLNMVASLTVFAKYSFELDTPFATFQATQGWFFFHLLMDSICEACFYGGFTISNDSPHILILIRCVLFILYILSQLIHVCMRSKIYHPTNVGLLMEIIIFTVTLVEIILLISTSTFMLVKTLSYIII